ncbi:MAG: hypothetical protein WDO18_23040 [Acidobacteriota bacterium]
MPALPRFVIPVVLVLICLAVMAQQVDFSQVDLGRHLKNGELILTGSHEEAEAVLHTNHYSYTAPSEPIVNHHWLSGVVFFYLWRIAGFDGLAILYTLLVASSICIVYVSAARSSDRWTAAGLAVASAPIIAWRPEPRPEGFTYFFIAVFYALLTEWFDGRLRSLWLWVLPPLLCLWINLHVAFVFGFFLLGVFGLKVIFAEGISALKGRLGLLLGISAVSLGLTLINPAGLQGVLYPFSIFGKIDFPVTELQSFAMLYTMKQWSWPHTYFFLLLGSAVGLVFVGGKKRQAFPWPEAIVVIVFGALALLQTRNMPFFSFRDDPSGGASDRTADGCGEGSNAQSPARLPGAGRRHLRHPGGRPVRLRLSRDDGIRHRAQHGKRGEFH